MNSNKTRNITGWVVCLAILFLCGWFFYRNVAGTDKLFGDDGDGRLTMLIAEHWYHVFRGKAAVDGLGIFYPVQNTLAFSDMLLGYGIIHSVLRAMGLNIYYAYRLTIVLVHAFGVGTLFLLLKHFLRISFGWSLLGTMAAFFSSVYAIYMSHTQLYAVGFVPLVFIFICCAVKNRTVRWKRILFMEAAVLQSVLILYTAWYIFFFLVLFTGVLILSELFFSMIFHRFRAEAAAGLKEQAVDLVLYLISFAVLVLPFVLLELPVLRNSGGRGYAEVAYFMPSLSDLITPPKGNWLLRKIAVGLGLATMGMQAEAKAGFNPVLVILFVAGVSFLVKKRRSMEYDSREYHLAAACLATAICCLLPINYGNAFYSPWRLVFHIVPGASSIRAVGRLLVFLQLPVAIVACIGGNMIADSIASSRGSRWLSGLLTGTLLTALFLTDISESGVYALWHAQHEMDFIGSVPAPPDDCAVFCLTGPDGSRRGNEFYQMDAYSIADHFGIPTINGYSGLFPEGWKKCMDLFSDEYLTGIREWILTHELHQVYSYDETGHIWEKLDIRSLTALDARKDQIPEDAFGLWEHTPGMDYCWTQKEFRMLLSDKNVTDRGLKVIVGTTADNYRRQRPEIEPLLEVSVNGEVVESLPVIDGTAEYILHPAADDEDNYYIELNTNCYFVPEDLGINTDDRELSLQLYYVGAA